MRYSVAPQQLADELALRILGGAPVQRFVGDFDEAAVKTMSRELLALCELALEECRARPHGGACCVNDTGVGPTGGALQSL